MKTLTERALTPLCVRFKEADLEVIRKAAARDSEAVTVWCREIILTYVTREEEGLEVPRLRFETGDLGQPFSIRFRPVDYKRVARRAAAADRSITAWARAVVVSKVSS